MKGLILRAVAVAAATVGCALAAPSAGAVTTGNFQLRTTQDLAELCGAQPGEPQSPAAIHQCQGFIVGVYQYHQSMSSGRDGRPVFCLPAQGGPSRDEAARMVVTWARSHPEHMGERPVDGLARWAVETWPCPRAPARRPARRPAQ